MKLSDDQVNKLNQPLDDKAVNKHPTKPYLSSIRSIYVTERFNDVFGVGGWTAKAKVIDANEGAPVLYVVFEVPEHDIRLAQFGGNDNGGVNNKNYDLGDAYKGAMTDALTKIASYLGIGADVFKGLHDEKGNRNPDHQQAKQNGSAPKTNGTSSSNGTATKTKEPEPKQEEQEQPEPSGNGDYESFIRSADNPMDLISWWKDRLDEGNEAELKATYEDRVFNRLETIQ